MSTLPASASEKLEQLLRKRSTGKLITSTHRKVIAQICDEARRSGMSIERLVVLLKGVLARTPHAEDSAHSRDEIRERLIAVCIEEYFRNDDSTTR